MLSEERNNLISLISNPSVVAFSIDGVDNYTSEDIFAITPALLTNKSITSLNIIIDETFDPLKILAISNIIKNNNNITRLKIECDTNLDSSTVESILATFLEAIASNHRLLELNLSSNPLNENTFAILINTLNFHPSITSIDLSNLAFDEQDQYTIGPTCMRSLIDLLRANPRIKKLNLDTNRFDAASLLPLFIAIQNGEIALHSLSISECGEITEEMIQALAVALKNNTPLKKLTLWETDITDSMAELLAQALESNTSLKDIDVSHCNITEVGMAAFAKSLQKNHSLQLFDFNNMPKQHKPAIKALLDRNKIATTYQDAVTKANLGDVSSFRLALQMSTQYPELPHPELPSLSAQIAYAQAQKINQWGNFTTESNNLNKLLALPSYSFELIVKSASLFPIVPEFLCFIALYQHLFGEQNELELLEKFADVEDKQKLIAQFKQLTVNDEKTSKKLNMALEQLEVIWANSMATPETASLHQDLELALQFLQDDLPKDEMLTDAPFPSTDNFFMADQTFFSPANTNKRPANTELNPVDQSPAAKYRK